MGTDEATNINLLQGGFIMTKTSKSKKTKALPKEAISAKETAKKAKAQIAAKDKKEVTKKQAKKTKAKVAKNAKVTKKTVKTITTIDPKVEKALRRKLLKNSRMLNELELLDIPIDRNSNTEELKKQFVAAMREINSSFSSSRKLAELSKSTTNLFESLTGKKVTKVANVKDKKEKKGGKTMPNKLIKNVESNKELKSKVTESMLNHEISRLCSMDDDQMKARIKKIKSPVKLEALRIASMWCGVRKFARLARIKRNAMMV